ncbi:N-acetylmuramoyl-L-alanine amidase [Streptomyces sp. NPDC021020]|uniref:N-acetylmuramoyl-L-alanine amidase n=1 Tax=Streptomyces sp. NPDC021020 TaxID=3365109 RepID=UPI0037B6723A
MFSNESHGGTRSRSLAVTAVVVVAALAGGWFVYDAHRGTDAGSADGRGPGAAPAAGRTTPAAVAHGDASATPGTASATPRRELTGRTVVLDPGHNLGNATHTAEIGKLVDIGTNRKACDTTGTATNAGYPEATYTLDVAHRAKALLEARGAKVVLTYDGDRPYGPCVDERARTGNAAHADAALSIHADGAPADKFGFHVIAPKSLHKGAADTRAVAAPSLRLATTLRSHFHTVTGEPLANYLGGKGLTVRDDLGGLNLTTVPKVFIECGNMRNAHDAAEMTDPAWRQKAAEGIADGLTAFLEGKR